MNRRGFLRAIAGLPVAAGAAAVASSPASATGGKVSRDLVISVNMIAASGDEHFRRLVQQGISDGLGNYARRNSFRG